MTLQAAFDEKTVNELRLMFDHGQINLEPGFQRQSVWTLNDRRRLIESIFAGYPVPSIFLYRRSQNGQLMYDVIDGKQRLETLFMFMGAGRFRGQRFEAKVDLGDRQTPVRWEQICRKSFEKRLEFDSYKFQTVEVTGDLSEIIELFLRINSTGKHLTSGEKRHARFYTSRFLREAERLVRRYEGYIRETKILSAGQIGRMKGTELFAEILMSLHHGGPINKKTALDRSIGNADVNGNTLARLSREFTTTINRIRTMFPHLREIRMRNSAEFYTLFLLVWEMEREKFVLKDRRRNRAAFELLRRLSTGVDLLREQLRHAKPAKQAQRLYADYLLTVQGDTDSSANRQRRAEILRGLLFSIFERKDERRVFSTEQRRIIWNTDEKRVCPRCHRAMTWNDFSVDHIVAHAKGGKTSLKNAQIMCKRCNSRKGAR